MGVSARQPATVPGNSHACRLHPAVVHAQRREQRGAQRDVAITAALPVLNVNQHAPAVDVRDLQMAQLRVPHAGRVQDHQHRAMRQAVRRVDQPRDLVARSGSGAADAGPSDRACRRGRYRRFSVFTKKKRIAQTCSFTVRGASFRSRRRYAWYVRRWVGIQSVGRALEVPGELLDGVDVVRDRRRGVVATVELVQHRLSEMGHKTPPVTHTLPGRSAEALRVASAAPAASS